MRFAAVSAFLGLAACVRADTVNVMVAQNGTLTFTPGSVTANEGDVISFQFLAGNHTVTQSSFTDPCTMLTTPSPGIDSGFQAVSANATMVPQYSFSVTNASTPLWFYCRQARHCESGMVFAVNPTATNTFDAFKARAMGTNTTSSSPGSSSTKSVPSQSGSSSSPSASGYSNSAPLRFDSSKLTGIIGLVAVVAGSVL
jgi:plastocyanin